MLGIDPKAARITWTIFLISLLILLAYLARHTLLIFTLALFFAYMLSPAVEFVGRLLPARVSPTFGLAVVYAAFVAILIGTGISVGAVVAEQATTLTTKLPQLAASNDPLGALPLPHWIDPLRMRVNEVIRTQVQGLDKQAFPLIRRALQEVAARAGGILEGILVPILAFFFLKDGRAIKEAIVAWTTRGTNSVLLDEIFADVHVLLGHYIRALFILSLATFAVYTLFLQLTGAQFSILLGGIAAALEFIPVVGPLTASVIIILVEGFTGFPHVLWIVIFLLIYRLFQDYVLTPYLMGTGVELHPLLVLFGVLAGEQVAGIPGMFLSVPLIAVLRVVYVRLQRERVARQILPPES